MNNIFALMRGTDNKNGLDTLVGALADVVSRHSPASNSDNVRGLTMATESLGGDLQALAGLKDTIKNLDSALANAIADSGVNLNTMGLEGIQEDLSVGPQLSDLSMHAAGVVAAAFANPRGYADAAMRAHSTPNGARAMTVATEGLGGSIVHAQPMAMEAFSEQPMRDMAGWSIVLAATGAKQDEFCEAFFKYILVGAGDMGLTVTLARAQIVNSPNFDQSGDPNDLGRVNLIDAARNPELLEDESTRVYPVLHQDPNHSSRKYLVAGAAADEVTIEQNKFNTAPLAFGEVGLVPVSTPDYLVVPGVMDLTDALGQGGRVKYVLLKVGDDFIRLNTRELNGFGFLPAQEGNSTRQVLNATSRSITVGPKTRNDRGELPVALKPLRDNGLTVRFTISVNGELDLMNTIAYVDGTIRSVNAVVSEDGTEVPTSGGAGAAAVQLLKEAKLVGWYPDIVRTNENLRTLGKLFDTLEERFAYGIPFTSPYSVLAPVGSAQPAKNLETLIAAQRRRMHSHGVTTLLNHMANVEASYEAKRAGLEVAEIGSVGSRLTKAYFKRIFIDAKKTQSVRDNDKALDLAAKITNIIRFHAAEMAVETGYTAALEASTRGSKKLRLLVGTSIQLHQQLMVTGDLRTFGPLFNDPIVVSTLNKKMDGKIIVTFTRESEPNHPDELAFGWCAGLPELVTVVDTRRGGSMRKEATTQGRYLYIPNLPFGFIVEVLNLEEGLIDPSIYRLTVEGGNGSTPAPFPGSGGTGGGTGTDPNADGGTTTP